MPQKQDHHLVIQPEDLQDELLNATMDEDDFTKFLDLDTDFQFSGLDNGHSGLDTPMGRLGFEHSALQSMQDIAYNEDQIMNIDMSATSHPHGFSLHGVTSNQQFEAYQQYPHMSMGHNYHVPPTPISSEMHAAKYGQRRDAAGNMIFDTHQVSFTPLVSPAQTPLTGGFGLPEYGMSDDFFSPLTSPAIEAQGASSVGSTTSPADIDVDSTAKSSAPATRSRRRKASFSTSSTSRPVKHSPAVKPQLKRRQQSLNTLPVERIQTILKQPSQSQLKQLQVLGSNTSRASDDSVSPEPLSEILMRPPPVPSTVEKSPRSIMPSESSATSNPATPATLMKMPSDQRLAAKAAEHAARLAKTGDGQMEDIMLPDAAAPSITQPTVPRIDTNQVYTDEQSTPTLSAKPTRSGASGTPKSAAQESFTKPIKIESKSGRGSKKRQGTASATMSPALRPKISPSISPLVPASAPGMPHLSAETSALYLASKSNYQNIIDGTHLPGVSYPEALAENLSSKRTSHKIAEQGRRNRINLALKEIESLLPPSIAAGTGKKERTGSTETEDGDKPSASGQGASKASTVEMAIVYIKSLRAELADTREKLTSAEKRLAEASSSAGSQASE